MNTAFAVYVSDYGIRQVRQNAPNEIAVQAAFLLFFASEMCSKLCVRRLYFFCNGDMVWNLFDLFLGLAVLGLADPGVASGC